MVNTVTLNGNSYNDGSTPPGNMGNGGHRENLLPMLSDLLKDAGKALITTSASSLAIGTGNKVFVLAEDRPFSVGAFVIATDRANVVNQMFGKITAKAGTSITVDVSATSGGGTIADWEIQISGPIGPAGSPPAATTASAGIARLATQGDVDGGVVTDEIVTPETLKATTLIRGRLIDVQVFTADGTWNKPAGCNFVLVELVGGGGAGGGAVATSSGQISCGAGGGGGAYAMKWITAALGATENVTVGAGGTANSGAAGGAGGSSAFGSHVTAVAGGTGGPASGAAAQTGTNDGGAGGASATGAALVCAGQAGATVYASTTVLASASGGASGKGFGGGAYGKVGNGIAAQLYGGGGGGATNPASSSAKSGGAGAAGVVIVWSYA